MISVYYDLAADFGLYSRSHGLQSWLLSLLDIVVDSSHM